MTEEPVAVGTLGAGHIHGFSVNAFVGMVRFSVLPC